ncbi:MAG: hydroxylamine reductase [Candidatus Margulisiibacteriota bacterium]
MNMFCYQCQETAGNKGCTVAGVCGKPSEVANLQDELIAQLQGLAIWATAARQRGVIDDQIDLLVVEGLFLTVTNVNFDPKRMEQKIAQAKELVKKTGATIPSALGALAEKNEDLRSLKQLLLYGLKGLAAYANHAYILKKASPEIFAFIHKALAATVRSDISADELVGLVLAAGQNGVAVMALLDKANTEAYGHPVITKVATGTKAGKAILVSGHDLLDLDELLQQTVGKGINVYTHGEMLPANAYPGLKKYPHLAGNYGTAWHAQQREFANFPGAILFTTNCIQKPLPSYQSNLFTAGLAGWPGVSHIADRADGKQKDFSAVIQKALSLPGLSDKPGKELTIGFAHNTILSLADKVVAAVKSGAIKRFFVMAGCDGRLKERQYFTDLAQALPADTVILTAGCAKFRYNQLELGDIGGIPRVLDAGQCNDSYSLAVVALKLVEVFGVKSVNELPLSFDLGWYEQKAVIVLLALLYLGVKNIRLGPTVPAFLSPNVVRVLVEKFAIKPTGEVKADLAEMLAGR